MCQKTRLPIRSSVAAVLLTLLAALPMLGAGPKRILVFAGHAGVIEEASALFEKKHGSGLVIFELGDEANAASQLARADLIFFYFQRRETCRLLAPELEKAHKRGVPILSSPIEVVQSFVSFKIDAKRVQEADLYWRYGGAANIGEFLAWAYKAAGGTRTLKIDPPQFQATQGIYHPLAWSAPGGPRQFSSLKDYLAWYQQQRRVPTGAPLVAITFYSNNVRFGDTAHIDAMIAALEKAGIGVVPVFGWPISQLDPFLTVDGKSPVRVILGLNLTILKSEDVAALERYEAHVINLLVTRENAKTWTESVKGLPVDRIPMYLNVPERAGATEPFLIATSEESAGGTTTRPVAERVEALVRRVRRWITLHDKPNIEKRIVILYYNNPPGKGNLGASYLRIPPTLEAMLRRLREAGYLTGSDLPDEATLLNMLQKSGRNVELWAPGELEAMVNGGGLTLVSMTKYKRWFSELPRQFRDAVNKEWGPPEQAKLMCITSRDGEKYFVIPGVRFGNIFVGPQPLRSTFERAMDTAHDPLTPVPHSYVAAYLWYRHEFQADAVVHVGRHGTLEWLPGKQTALAGWDHEQVLLGDLPNPYLYIMDGGGEAIQAKRRGSAVLMSHLTPLIVTGGKQAEFDKLHQLLEQYEKTEGTAPELATEYKQEIISEARRLKLDKQLGIDWERTPWNEAREQLHDFAHGVENGPIPAGIHALGQLPSESVQREAIADFLKYGFQESEWKQFESEVSEWAGAIYEGRQPQVNGNYPPALRDKILTALPQAVSWLRRLRESPQRELDALPLILSGRYQPTGLLGDPMKVPDALPSGRNLHAFDAALIPTKAAWALGGKMAEQMLARYRKEKGGYPSKVSMSLWYGETERHQGAMESMALHLMGVEPVWNARGVVVDLRLIPDAELKRPRIDVVFTISGIYRDGFGDKVLLLDRAARLAASAGDNAISRNDLAIAEALVKSGLDRTQAEKIARARVFGTKPGHYGIGIQRMVEQSKDAGRQEELAGLFFHYMNYAFSSETWGATAPKALESHLKGNEVVLFSRSSNLYGALDNDDTYAYVGGLNLATKVANGGVAPQFYIHNLRKSDAESLVDMKTWLARELNARAWNPKWLKEMQRSGYAGAREMFKELEHLYGFQATSPEQMDGTFWQNSYDVYVADKHGFDMDKFFEKENPFAQQWIVSRLLEVDRQGSYRFSDAERARLVETYVRSVNRHGVSCSANTCGNQRLHQFVAEQAFLIPGLGSQELRAFGERVARATRPNPAEYRRAPAAFQAGLRSELARLSRRQPARATSAVPVKPVVAGYKIEERRLATPQLANVASAPPVTLLCAIAMVLPVLVGACRELRRKL